MALYLERVSNNGIISKYHKISSVSLRNSELICHIDSYANKEYRDSGCDHVLSEMYFFNCSIEEEESMGIRQLAYSKLKELEEWQGAEDC